MRPVSHWMMTLLDEGRASRDPGATLEAQLVRGLRFCLELSLVRGVARAEEEAPGGTPPAG